MLLASGHRDRARSLLAASLATAADLGMAALAADARTLIDRTGPCRSGVVLARQILYAGSTGDLQPVRTVRTNPKSTGGHHEPDAGQAPQDLERDRRPPPRHRALRPGPALPHRRVRPRAGLLGPARVK